MKRVLIASALILTMAAPVLGQEGTVLIDTTFTEYPKAVLGKAYSPVLGDMVAITISQLLGAMKPIDAAMTAGYDRKAGRVEVLVIGTRASVDGAKETLDEFRNKAVPMVIRVIQRTYGVELGENQLTVICLNRYGGNKEIVRRENGQYVVR